MILLKAPGSINTHFTGKFSRLSPIHTAACASCLALICKQISGPVSIEDTMVTLNPLNIPPTAGWTLS